jgi:PAS domain S-box-containing protein
LIGAGKVNKYKALFENAADAIFLVDEKGKYIDVNKKALEVSGYSKKELIGKTIEDFIPPGTPLKIFPKILKEGVASGEFELLRKDGTLVPVELKGILVEIDGRKVVQGIVRDITGRKEAEREIKQNHEIQHMISSISKISAMPISLEEQLEVILELIISIPWLVLQEKGVIFLVEDDPETLVMKVQKGLPLALQTTCEKVPIGKCICGIAAATKEITFADRIDDRHEVRYKSMLPHGHYCVPVLSGKRVLGVLNLYVKEGHKRDQRVEKFLSAVANTLAGVIERKRLEESLKRSVEEFTTVHEIDRSIIKMPDLSSLLRFIVGKARELTDADAAFYGFVDEEGVIHHHTFSGIRTNAFKNIKLKKGAGLGWLALGKKKPVATEDFFTDKRLKGAPYDAVRKEGLVSMLAVPFMVGDGKPMGVLYVSNRRKTRFTKGQARTLATLAGQSSIAVEHTRLFEKNKKGEENLERAHEKLQQAYEELKSLDELKSDIISNVSHELRTPITIIRGALEIAMEEKQENERNELFKMAMDALVRQNSIVGDLIEATKLNGKKKSKPMPVDVARIMTIVSSEFEPLILKNKLEMKVDVEKDIPFVKARSESLLHILRSLLSNAVKFNKEGGKVTLTAKEKERTVELCVSDTGIGIPKDKLDKIFECLYQLDSSSVRPYGGIGMGLAIAKDTVEASGGKIWVESTKGRGSKFYFTLPVAR